MVVEEVEFVNRVLIGHESNRVLIIVHRVLILVHRVLIGQESLQATVTEACS
jgi:hypothetical protein